MDPITAFSLATNVITIIQTGIKAASEVRDVYRSETGARERDKVLEEATNTLDTKCDQLLKCLQAESREQRLSPAELELRDIAIKCTQSAKKLNSLLVRLKAKPRKRDALLKTIKARFKQDEIDELQKEVDSYRNALNTLMLTDLRIDLSNKNSLQQKSALSQAESLKDTLWFPQMHHRHEQIRDAYPGTFQWIFNDAEATEISWDSFNRWLQNDEGLYWIKGKAGSGKSTLMNYISYDAQTQDLLKTWAGDTPVIIAKFFFWNSGTALEKSQRGLLRTILYQILDKSPDLAVALFRAIQPGQIASLCDADSRDSYWTEKKLIGAFEQLLSVQGVSQSFCFFIDGLDEFDGDHELLVDLLQRLCSARHVKVCIASRPVAAFEAAFAQRPSLMLQDLTANDIRRYITEEFQATSHGQDLATNNAKPYQRFVGEILRKASGVFLWVRLVVKRLLKNFSAKDTVEILEARLNEMPVDLTELFRNMLGSFDPIHQKEAARIFKTIFAAPDAEKLNSSLTPSLSIIDLLFVEKATIGHALAHHDSVTDWEQLETR